MGPSVKIPSTVTALYIFAVVNLTALLNITLVEANILVKDFHNNTQDRIPDRKARFGGDFPEDGLWGRLKETDPRDACHKIAPAPAANQTLSWIALIRRNDCDFDVKVLNAQSAGFAAAVVYDPKSDDLVAMGGGKMATKVTIPAAFIGETDATKLKETYTAELRFTVIIDDGFMPINPNMYLLPFAIVVGICFILMLAFMIAKWVHDIRKRRKSRLSKQHLKKIPIKKFKKGDEYDVCAICLDEYEEGEKLRILPCAHAYHQVCIDPWLTKNKRVCPLCKARVIPGDETDSESDGDSDGSTEGAYGGEHTPLLTATDLPAHGRSAYSNSGLPPGLQREISGYSDTDSEDTSGPDSLNYSTSVDIHQPSVHRSSINGGCTPTLEVSLQPKVETGSLASSGGSRYGSLDTVPVLVPHLDDEEQAVGGQGVSVGSGVDNLAVDIMEDYYRTEGETQEAAEQQVAFSAEEAKEVSEDATIDGNETRGRSHRRRSYEEIV